ncbi:hypothetical protein K3495_g4715 [Podosphaera aphanis]|nr:hypothetical protein K3495_g4715 [Podosphaera aphanis]
MPPPQPSQHPPRGGTKSLTETLLLTTTAATTRTDEATLMFGPVASALAEATRRASALAILQHLVNTHQQFTERVQSVAQEFFDDHVRGVPNATTTTQMCNNGTRPTRQQTTAAPRENTPPVLKSTRPSSYAYAASNMPRRPDRAPRQIVPILPLDDRLFLRLEQDATERLLSPYPLLLCYRKFLALRPSSADAVSRLESLFSEGIKGILLGATTIEKAQNLVTYLLAFIPRTFTALNENNQLMDYPITEELIRAELMEEKGLTLVSVHETKGSIESPYYSSARYIARFLFGTNLPQKFYLFGVEVFSRQLAKKNKYRTVWPLFSMAQRTSLFSSTPLLLLWRN